MINPLSIVREVIRREGEVGGAEWAWLIIDENTKLSSTESSEKIIKILIHHYSKINVYSGTSIIVDTIGMYRCL